MVTNEMRAKLDKPYTNDEVGKAIKEMALLIAPGPDGMSPLFFQTYWTDVGMDVTQFVLSSLNSNSILKSVNYTFITLIPKVYNTEMVSDFRPITFTVDRSITDNIFIAFDSLHHMKTSCIGKKGFMAIKLDVSKCYDRVEWSFLERILLRLGFQESWVALIMKCITTVFYHCEWKTKGRDYTLKRCETRGSFFSLLIFVLCRRVKCFVVECCS